VASGVDAAFVALLAAHVLLVHDARSLFDCLVDRFGKPLRRFNTLAPLDARLSGSQRNAIVSRMSAQVCYVLVSWLLRHCAKSDFLADNELFADSRSCWWQRAEVCRLARGLLPRVAGRDGAAVSPQAAGVRGGDQENAQVLRRRARSEEPLRCSTTTRSRSRGRGVGGAPTFVLVRPSEVMSRAWMNDAVEAHARDCPHHQTSSTASAAGWRRK
jgi:hypothetical protein